MSGFAVAVGKDGRLRSFQFPSDMPPSEALLGMRKIGVCEESIAALSESTNVAKARHDVRHPETGQYARKKTGLFRHGGAVLQSVRDAFDSIPAEP
jgi:hypothetical protein